MVAHRKIVWKNITRQVDLITRYGHWRTIIDVISYSESDTYAENSLFWLRNNSPCSATHQSLSLHQPLRSHTVQLWGNGCSFDNVILRRAYALTDTPFAVPFWNDRDVRTMVELGKSVGINPRYDIPFEGDMHNALSDARHQVKYVSAIWKRLTAN